MDNGSTPCVTVRGCPRRVAASREGRDRATRAKREPGSERMQGDEGEVVAVVEAAAAAAVEMTRKRGERERETRIKDSLCQIPIFATALLVPLLDST